MKKHALLTAAILAMVAAGFSQNCKYAVNGIDKFTNVRTKQTKPQKIIGTFYTTGEFSIKQVDTAFAVVFDYVLSSYSKFDPYSLVKGQLLQFLLEDGSTVTLKSDGDLKGMQKTTFGVPPVYSCNLSNATYPVSRNEMLALAKSKVKTIRFYKTEASGKESPVDNDLKSRDQDDIQEMVKCML